jgi:hypothetical protein
MTYEFEYLMHLYACGSRGLTPQPPRQPIDFDRLIQLAHEQSVLPLVGVALSNATNVGLPSEKAQALVARTRSLALTNYFKKGLILKLLKDFEEAGIKAVLLKGFAVADLYAEPNCRISTDTDIYIDKKDEKRACKLLKDHGCNVNPRPPLSHHAVCEHPQMGHIELHVILYDEFVENIWFGKMDDRQFIQEELKRYEDGNGSCLILGSTDNLIFLALHMIKHFILRGTSLRQMMDIALYLKIHQAQIDLKRFWATLDSLKYRKLINTVLSVMVSYSGFTSEDFIGFEKADEATTSALLNDLETGGWLGNKESEKRKGSWFMYNRIRYTEKRTSLSYWCYMIKRNTINYICVLFPVRAALEKKFPYVKKTIWLVPAAWIHRLLFGIWKLLCGKMDTGFALRSEQVSSDDKGRDYLFKLMNMM